MQKFIFFIFLFSFSSAFGFSLALTDKCLDVSEYIISETAKAALSKIDSESYLENLILKYDHICSPAHLEKTKEYGKFFIDFNDNKFDLDLLKALASKITEVKKIPAFAVTDNNFSLLSDRDYCNRDTQILDKITIHHAETPNYFSFKRMNEVFTQMKKGYGIAGYHFLLRTSYEQDLARPNGEFVEAEMGTGRPTYLLGGHNNKEINGFNYKYTSAETILKNKFISTPKSWEEAKPYAQCFHKTKKGNSPISLQQYFQDDGYMSENLRSLGIGVIGTYFSGSTKRKLTMADEGVNLIAKTICKLAKTYPNIYFVDVHQDTQSTDCPGNVRSQLPQIQQRVAMECFEEGIMFPYTQK